jgi:hypothetical protein
MGSPGSEVSPELAEKTPTEESGMGSDCEDMEETEGVDMPDEEMSVDTGVVDD